MVPIPTIMPFSLFPNSIAALLLLLSTFFQAPPVVESKYDVELPSLVKLFIFFENLPEYRKNMSIVDDGAAQQQWRINTVYDSRGWGWGAWPCRTNDENIPQCKGLAFLLDTIRYIAADDGRQLVRLEKPWLLAYPAVHEEWGHEIGDLKIMDAAASMRPCIYGVDRLRRALAMVSDEIKFHFDIYVHLFPLAIFPPAKYKEEWGEFSAAKETEEQKKQMKFMILAAAERIEKQPEGKNLDQIVKKCEHFLLDFIDPRLGMDAIDMIPLSIGTPQFATLLGTTLNLTSVTFQPSNSHWTEMIYGGGDKQGPKELVANFDKVLGEFVQLVQREWVAPIGMSTIKVDGDGGGGKRNKTLEEAGIFGKAEEFALVRQELTKWNLKDNLALSFDDGNLALLRVKWQVKVPFVRIKNRLKHLMNIVEWRIEGKLENWLPPHGGGTFTRLTCLGTIGNDSALFLVLSSHSQLEGVLRVDNLGSYFKKLIAERAH